MQMQGTWFQTCFPLLGFLSHFLQPYRTFHLEYYQSKARACLPPTHSCNPALSSLCLAHHSFSLYVNKVLLQVYLTEITRA